MVEMLFSSNVYFELDLTQVELLLKDLKTLKKSHLKKSVSLVISVVYKSVFVSPRHLYLNLSF